MIIVGALLGYLLGSVPFGIVVTRAMGLTDPRAIGSGSIGATNVLRTGSKPAAAATLALDALKAVVAVGLGAWIAGPAGAQVAGLAAFAGHLYPVWLRFRGGKGVATAWGVLLGLAPLIGLLALAVWIVAVRTMRISSVGGIAAALSGPVWALLLGRGDLLALTLVLAGLVVFAHRGNIARLRAGTEPRIGRRQEGGA